MTVPLELRMQDTVLLDIDEYRALKQAASAQTTSFAERQKEFNKKHKAWIDEQNRIVEEFGVFGEEYRVW